VRTWRGKWHLFCSVTWLRMVTCVQHVTGSISTCASTLAPSGIRHTCDQVSNACVVMCLREIYEAFKRSIRHTASMKQE
jgi:hypothetical protein